MNLEFGKNLKMLRRQKNLTQDELAGKLDLSVQAISRYETGAAYPDIEMLPVIAGFFGVTIDKLLGTSGDARERRREEYILELRKHTDRNERLALLRKQHAEFPDEWDVVSDMIYEMTHLPDCLAEMREIVDDATKNCTEPLWRENIILSYLRYESDEAVANAYIEKNASRYDMRKVQLLHHRYEARGEHEKLKSIQQKILLDDLTDSLSRLTVRVADDIPAAYENCHHVLAFIEHLSGNSDPTKPDMWITVRLMAMLRLSSNCFMLSKEDEGFSTLNHAVELFENFFSLADGTVLTYGSPHFDALSARTGKEFFYQLTQFSGMIATSMMMNLIYQTPLGPVDKNAKHYYDLEGFTRDIVFSDHTYRNILKAACWDGLAKVKDHPRYTALLERAKTVASIESMGNFLYFMDCAERRTDDFVQGKKWFCALLVRDVGAYTIFDDEDDIRAKFDRMKREGNTLVYQLAAVEFGNGYIEPPAIIKKRLIELNEDNRNAQVILRDGNGGVIHTAL